MAIALDSTSIGTDGVGTSSTYSHTCTGSNLVLFVAVLMDGADKITGITYNGVSMTQLTKVAYGGAGSGYTYIYGLVNPSTGANNIVVSASSSQTIYSRAASYTGVSQTGLPDSSATKADQAAQTSITLTTTTIADNCWLFGCMTNDIGPFTAGANTTLRYNVNSFAICDTNGAQTPAGSKSMTATQSSGHNSGSVISFAPSLPSSNGVVAFFMR